MKRPTCRTCAFVEPTGKGTRGTVDPKAPGEEVDIGVCHGDVPQLTSYSAGTFPPVTLDIDWCRHHPHFVLPTKRKKP